MEVEVHRFEFLKKERIYVCWHLYNCMYDTRAFNNKYRIFCWNIFLTYFTYYSTLLVMYTRSNAFDFDALNTNVVALFRWSENCSQNQRNADSNNFLSECDSVFFLFCKWSFEEFLWVSEEASALWLKFENLIKEKFQINKWNLFMSRERIKFDVHTHEKVF